MPAANSMISLAAATDLGLGGTLNQQVADETEEEKRKRKLGLGALQSDAARMLLGSGFGSGFGMAGVGKV